MLYLEKKLWLLDIGPQNQQTNVFTIILFYDDLSYKTMYGMFAFIKFY